jgi:hypothetical protein
MKLIIIFLSIIPIVCFGQSQVRLKSGESIDCTIKSLNVGVLTVSVKGNNMSFNQNDVEAIYFNKATAQQPIGSTQKATIKGVVTYFFNNNYGDKPDVGAKIYIRKIDTTNNKTSIFLNKYQTAKVCRSLMSITGTPDKYAKELKELGIESEKDFEDLSTNARKYLTQMKFDSNTKSVTADGNGNYTISADAGLYEVVYISKGRQGNTIVDIDGKIDLATVVLKAGDEVVKDIRFSLY